METEAIYGNTGHKIGSGTQNQNRTEAQNSRKWLVWITVCLGLICVLLVTALVVLYTHLTAESEQMKMRNMNIAEEYNETLSSLKTNYSHLTDEREELQKHFNSVMQKKLELETRVKHLSDELMKNLSGSIWYYISSEKKSWTDSRQFCRDRGGDLVIINTEEEQKYVSSIVNERAWIGLSDTEKEGNMKWVDNTPLNKGFWAQDEPNDNKGNEDCVEIWNPKPFLNNWNDLQCSETRKWVCEN
ncbi:putative CD209 antigen [Triplophysa rosa]|uniref:CD209 antigen n=1 Tax=Triplophysa rosa TaxID=992332 RepID=A0A9W7WZP8_TRIRA|nr:putative CD209 antigen [Triplophysa rosa]